MTHSSPQKNLITTKEVSWQIITALTVSTVVLVLLFGLVKYSLGYGQIRETIFNAVYAQWQLEDWGHCMMVPFAAAFIVYLERAKLKAVPMVGSDAGFWILLAGFFIYWFGFKADDIYFSYAAAQILLAGLVMWFGGWGWMRVLAFPWLFLVFMWPLLFLESFISFPLRLTVSHAGVVVLNLMGIPSILNGTGILSAADPLQHLAQGDKFAVDVALPCSGMRSLFALMMVSALYGYFTLKASWARLTLFLVSIPFAIAGNICRIVMLTAGTMIMGSEHAIGSLEHPSFFHMLAGYVVFLVALGGMVLVAGMLGQVGTVRVSEKQSSVIRAPKPAESQNEGDLY
jgi:exosortase